MRKSSRTFEVSLLVLAAILALPREAHAYLDPGTGSMVLQILVGGLLAMSFTIKRYWYRLKDLFNRRPPVAPEDGPGSGRV